MSDTTYDTVAKEADEVWRGDWIQTFRRKSFYPANPIVDDIDIEDIAHALSMQCRFAGHTPRFYSVAEHSVHVSRHCPLELRLWGLLHDATEAYLVDVPRPLKPMLKGYVEIENNLMQAVIKRFDLLPAEHMPPAVKAIDNRILFDERAQLMGGPVKPWNFDMEPLGIEIRGWSPEIAEMQFLDAFDRLTQ